MSKKEEQPFVNNDKSIALNDSSSDKKPPTDYKDTTNSLEFLRELNGKYPYEVDLLNYPKLKDRLIKLLGEKEYAYLKSIWEVQKPITVDSEYFVASAMQQHSGGDTEAIIVADLVEHKLFVGVRNKADVKFYSEENSLFPLILQEWSEN